MSLVESVRRVARSIRNDGRNLLFAARHCRNAAEAARAVLRHGGSATAVLRDGTTISAPEARTLMPLLKEIFIDRAYCRGEVYVRRGDVVVDIGAHVGAFAVHAARSGARRVIACEPSPANLKHLRRNIAANEATVVDVVAAAVGAREGEARLGLGRFSVGNVLLDEVSGGPVEAIVTVRTTTVAEIVARYGLERIDYLKIDCEGSEGAILSTLSPELLARVGCIALEYHDNWSSMDHRAIAELLGGAGFAVEVAGGTGPFGMVYAWRSSQA